MHPNNFVNKQALKLEIRKEMRENGVKPSTKMVNEILTDILNQIGIMSFVIVKRHCAIDLAWDSVNKGTKNKQKIEKQNELA